MIPLVSVNPISTYCTVEAHTYVKLLIRVFANAVFLVTWHLSSISKETTSKYCIEFKAMS